MPSKTQADLLVHKRAYIQSVHLCWSRVTASIYCSCAARLLMPSCTAATHMMHTALSRSCQLLLQVPDCRPAFVDSTTFECIFDFAHCKGRVAEGWAKADLQRVTWQVREADGKLAQSNMQGPCIHCFTSTRQKAYN